MRKTLIAIAATVVAVLLAILIADWALRMPPITELREAFVQAVRKGDAATVRALSVDSAGAGIWETLKSAQIDKADSFYTRGAEWPGGTPLTSQQTAYLKLTAENKSGLSVPFRLELIRDGIFSWNQWRIKAVVLGATK